MLRVSGCRCNVFDCIVRSLGQKNSCEGWVILRGLGMATTPEEKAWLCVRSDMQLLFLDMSKA